MTRIRVRPRISLIIKLYLIAAAAITIGIPCFVLAFWGTNHSEFNKIIDNKSLDPNTFCFPIAAGCKYSFSNDFGSPRSSSGTKRKHEGIDIMADRNTPIVAIEDCRIETIGWNTLGGNRIDIISMDGQRKYYYAHMEKCESGLDKGSIVKRGSIVGYVGSSGYGPPGSDTGAPPHLHVQIWIKEYSPTGDKYSLINPYDLLKFFETKRF